MVPTSPSPGATAFSPALARPRINLLQAIQITAALVVLISLIFLLRLGANPEIAFVFSGAFAIHAGMRPSRREMISAAAIGALLMVLYAATGAPIESYWISRVAGIGAAIGCGSLAVLCVRSFAGAAENSRNARAALGAASIIPVFAIVAFIAMRQVGNFPARTFDLYLYKFDSLLGFEPSFMAGQWFQHWHGLREFSALIYDALAFFPALVFGVAMHENRKLPFNPLLRSSWPAQFVSVSIQFARAPRRRPFFTAHIR
jgi:hypothetical protein